MNLSRGIRWTTPPHDRNPAVSVGICIQRVLLKVENKNTTMGKRTERMLSASLKHILKVNEDLKKKLKGKNHGELQKNNEPCDIIHLNVGGSEMFATRDTLTAIKGSRIEALFAGEWDEHLLRDEKGRIFMDLDPSLFEKILEYLSTAKISGEEDPVLSKLPNVGQDKYDTFRLYLEFFGLLEGKKEAAGLNGDTIGSSCSGVDNCSDTEDPMMQSFFSFFTDQEHGAQDEEYASIEDDVEADEYCFPDEQDNSGDEEASNDFQILNLQLTTGRAMSVKRSTLCSIASSKLAEDFEDDKWLDNHLIVNENGQKCILVEHCATAFKALVEQLRLRSMTGDHSRIPSVPYHDDFEGQSLKKLSAYYFPNNKSVICFSDNDDVSDLKVYTDSKVSELSSSCNAKINALEVTMENTKSEYEKNLIQYKSISEATATQLKTSLDTNMKGVTLASEKHMSEIMAKCSTMMNSAIIKSSFDCDKIKEWLASVNKTTEPKLLYRASRHGWNACHFHRWCDSKGATITVVKCTEGNVFGGYTSKSWASPAICTAVTDNDTFLFSLKNKVDLGAIKLRAHKNRRVHNDKSRGPIFGIDDLRLGSTPNLRSGLLDDDKCRTTVGSTYKLPNGIYDRYFLTGSEFFQVEEYEVFQV